MISRIHLQNLGIFEQFEWEELGSINVIVGEKLLYSVSRSLEEYRRKQATEAPRWSDVLVDKLRWTFQPPDFAIGELVRKGTSRMRVDCRVCDEPVFFAFGDTTTKQINDASRSPKVPKDHSTLFFPPKEVLTHRKAIAASRERGEVEGFGDAYYDLVQALGHSTTSGPIQENLRTVMNRLQKLFDGKVKREDDEFIFQKGSKKFSMSQTAEGVKKIGLMTHLIRNRHIQSDSILFFDEPAAHLHPQATLDFVRMLYEMSKADIQLFIATHSYVVLKQFELLARQHGEQMPLCVLEPREEDGIDQSFADLSDMIPSNSIVDASVDLFERDLDLSFSS
jgi:hypothetical protein